MLASSDSLQDFPRRRKWLQSLYHSLIIQSQVGSYFRDFENFHYNSDMTKCFCLINWSCIEQRFNMKLHSVGYKHCDLCWYQDKFESLVESGYQLFFIFKSQNGCENDYNSVVLKSWKCHRLHIFLAAHRIMRIIQDFCRTESVFLDKFFT